MRIRLSWKAVQIIESIRRKNETFSDALNRFIGGIKNGK